MQVFAEWTSNYSLPSPVHRFSYTCRMDKKSPHRVWDCRYFHVEESGVVLADGNEYTWYSVHRPNPHTVHILAIDEQGRVPLLRQYRVPLGNWVWELPAGVCDVEGEKHADTANRELLEETGYHAAEVIHLFSGTVSPGLTDEMYHAYLCLGLTKAGEGGGLNDERIEVRLMPFVQLQDFLLARQQDGELVDCKILAHLALVWRVFGEVAARELEGDRRSLDSKSRLRDILGVIQAQLLARDQSATDSNA